MRAGTSIAAKISDPKNRTPATDSKDSDLSKSKSSPVDQILFLQKTIGNQAAKKILQSGNLQSTFEAGRHAQRGPADLISMHGSTVQGSTETVEQRILAQGPNSTQIIPLSPIPLTSSTAFQRQADEADAGPSEEEKAAALAAAKVAEQIAAQAKSKGKEEVVKSKAEKAAEKEAGQAAKEKAESAKGGTEGKAEKGEAVSKKAEAGKKEKAEAKGKTAPAAAKAPRGGKGAAGPEDKAPKSSEEDPVFQNVVGKIKGVGAKEQAHAPAESKANEAQDAAEAPASEVESKAQSNQVGEMEQTETPGFDAAAFKAQLMERIAALAPRTTEEADKFKEENKLGGLKGEMQGKVKEEQAASQAPLGEKTAAPPDPSGIEPKPVHPLIPADPGAKPASVGASAATPKHKGKSEIEAPLQENSKKLDQQMAEADITEEQLAKSNEPEFKGALASKKEAQAHANQAPGEYRQFEQDQLSKAENDASAKAQEKTQGMHADRGALFTEVEGRQGQAKAKDKQARAKVAGDIRKIYDKTKVNVKKILNNLDTKAGKTFDTGAAAAKQAFEDYVDAKVEAYKEKRYGGWFGWAKWAKDKLLGMPSEVNNIYREGRWLFLEKMDAVIDNVVTIIGTGLTEAKAEIASGKKEIQEYVNQLPDDLQAVGQEAEQNIQDKFDALEQSIDDKQNELIDTLASKYQENLQAVDARIEEIKAANRGLVDKVIDAVAGVIKTILKLKDMLLKVLAKVASVVVKIIKDPIGFLGNLISGLKQGFQNFAGNILQHLQKGLIGWLTGSLGPMGIQLPDDIFSLKGIFSLVMQILGLTWDYIRAKAVKLMGEPVVKALETAFTPFKILITEGPAGLWEFIKEQLSDLKEMVMDKIKELIIVQVIKAGIKWLMGLLSPVGAFIKAAMAIYDIVMFFIEKGSQILELVSSIVDAVGAIAGGAISAAAKLVENALAKALPLVIGFLASLLGLGGLAKKVHGIIKKVRKRIDKAIDKMLMKAKKIGRKLLGKLGIGKEKREDEKAKTEHEIEVKEPFAMAGTGHHIYAEERKGGLIVEMSTKRRENLAMLTRTALFNERKGAKREKVIKRLERGLSKLEDLKWSWKAAHSKSDAEKRAIIKKQIEDVANNLKGIGVEFGIDDLANLGHPSKYVEVDQLKNPKDIRKRFYKSSYRDIEWDIVVNRAKTGKKNTAEQNLYECQNDGKKGPKHKPLLTKNEITIEHKRDVAIHWNEKGHNMTQQERDDWYDDPSNLAVWCRSCNSSKPSVKYKPKVGPNFRGRDDE